MRNSLLANVVAMLKIEIGYNIMSGVAVAEDVRLAALVAEKQRWLSDVFDWPFLKAAFDVNAVPGARYLALPTMNFERPVTVEVYWASNWQSMDYGIGTEEYNSKNSENNPPDMLNPIQRWDMQAESAASNQFEVWPIPASVQKVRFTGQRSITTLLSMTGTTGPAVVAPIWTNTVDLDDQMVMLFAAAEKLQLMGKGNAPSVLKRAQDRMMQIRASYPTRDVTCGFQRSRLQRHNKLISIVPIKKILIG